MNFNNVDFVTYCIGNLLRRLGLSAGEVYRRLKKSGILTEYIVPSYDVLHTFGKEYLMEELIDIKNGVFTTTNKSVTILLGLIKHGGNIKS